MPTMQSISAIEFQSSSITLAAVFKGRIASHMFLLLFCCITTSITLPILTSLSLGGLITLKNGGVCVKNMLMRRLNRHISDRRNGVSGEKRRTHPSLSVDSLPPVTPMTLSGVGLTQKIRIPTMGCGRLAQPVQSSGSCSGSRG